MNDILVIYAYNFYEMATLTITMTPLLVHLKSCLVKVILIYFNIVIFCPKYPLSLNVLHTPIQFKF